MIFSQVIEQLKSISHLLLLLNEKQYQQKVSLLGNSSIGGHIRHIVEILKCTTSGYITGKVDYLNRDRNLQIETDKTTAMLEINHLIDQVILADKPLKIVIESTQESTTNYVTSSYFREIAYNSDHTIHHLALIKVALIEMQLDIVGADFGMAYSTRKYLASQNHA